MLFALIPAGGRSQRMGSPKLLLPLPPSAGSQPHTVVECVIQAFQSAGIDRIVVVTPPQLPEIAVIAQAAGAVALVLPKETSDMRATVEVGLEWVEKTWSPHPNDGWFLSPADHPAMDPAVIAKLAAVYQENPQRTLFVPIFHGRRGHPALIHWSHVSAVRALPQGQGLNAYFRTKPGETVEVPVDRPGILDDLDTPEDYRRLFSS